MAFVPPPAFCCRPLAKRLIFGHDAYILLFGLASRETFGEISQWREWVERQALVKIRLLAIIGITPDADQDHEVSSDEGRALAATLDVQYLESSKDVPATIEATIATWAQQYDHLKLQIE